MSQHAIASVEAPMPGMGRGRGADLLFDPRVLRLLTFLTRTQGWLSVPEMARRIHAEGEFLTARTLYRWLSELEAHAGLAYFPYPRMNLLGLQEVVVRVYGLRNPAVLGMMPFSNSFLGEIGLGDGIPYVTQGYWIPFAGMREFRDYWRTAVELGLVEKAEVLVSRNAHFLFSPFEDVITDHGWFDIVQDLDNGHFVGLLRRHLNEPFETRLGDAIAQMPVCVPLILEHLWGRFSSRHVWMHFQVQDRGELRRYGRVGRALHSEKPGSGLKHLQQAWRVLLHRFDEAFLQPVVFVPPQLFRNALLVTFVLRTGSTDRIVEAAARVSENALMTSVMPGLDAGGQCRIWCLAPSGRLSSLVRLVRKFHRSPAPLSIGMIDVDATRQLARPDFCRFEWRSFDPANLTWEFDGERYMEELKELRRAPTRVLAGKH